MSKNKDWEIFLILSKVNAKMTRRLDSSLGGLGWNDFVVLYHLDNSDDKKMRRIDLAEKIGLTASGVTRLLLPMEKVGLIKKEVNKDDARVSLVSITKGGRNYLDEAMININRLSEEIFNSDISKDLKKVKRTLKSLYKNV